MYIIFDTETTGLLDEKLQLIELKDYIIKINFVLEEFNLIGHNVFFDIKIVCAEFIRINKKIIDTKEIIVLLKWVI